MTSYQEFQGISVGEVAGIVSDTGPTDEDREILPRRHLGSWTDRRLKLVFRLSVLLVDAEELLEVELLVPFEVELFVPFVVEY